MSVGVSIGVPVGRSLTETGQGQVGWAIHDVIPPFKSLHPVSMKSEVDVLQSHKRNALLVCDGEVVRDSI